MPNNWATQGIPIYPTPGRSLRGHLTVDVGPRETSTSLPGEVLQSLPALRIMQYQRFGLQQGPCFNLRND